MDNPQVIHLKDSYKNICIIHLMVHIIIRFIQNLYKLVKKEYLHDKYTVKPQLSF